MDAEGVSTGSSPNLPLVQDLVNRQIETVPDRYVRHDQDPPITHDVSLPNEIPVINLQNLLSADSKDSELQKLHSACKEWGFFQLIDHGVCSTLMKKVKGEIRDLFELPMEEKKKLWQEPGDIQGFGHQFIVSDEQKLDWGDLFYIELLPTHTRKQELFAKLSVSFRETMEAYSLEVKRIFVMLLDQIAKSLKIARVEEITDSFEEVGQTMRLNYYPPCPQPNLVTGLAPHSDAGYLTIVLQLNDVEGLQIRKEGKWVPIKPLPDAFVVNLGDSLEIATNGIYRSIEHRGMVNKEKERLSVAAFHSPNLNGYVRPAPSLVTPENPAQFRGISFLDLYKGYYSRELQGKSFLEFMRIESNEGQQN